MRTGSRAVMPPPATGPATGTAPARDRPPVTLEEIYDLYAGYVARTATRILGTHDEVPDIVQETFVIAAEHLSEIRNPDAVKGWLATVAVRRVARRLRERKLRALFLRELAACSDAVVAPGTPPEDVVRIREIYAVLETLPAACRIAWVLRYYEGESVEEVANICRISFRTAKRRIAVAQDRLRKVLDARRR